MLAQTGAKAAVNKKLAQLAWLQSDTARTERRQDKERREGRQRATAAAAEDLATERGLPSI